MAKPTEKQLAALLKLCHGDEAEVQRILNSDSEVDKGIPQEHDLSPEAHKAAMKYANVGEKKKPEPKANSGTATAPPKRERKANPTKGGIIEALNGFLIELGYENVNITNKERQIAFSIGDNNFELTLVQKRKPKA